MTEAEKLKKWNEGGAQAFFNWCRRQRRKEQYRFERLDTVPISVLGFDGVDSLVEAMVDRRGASKTRTYQE